MCIILTEMSQIMIWATLKLYPTVSTKKLTVRNILISMCFVITVGKNFYGLLPNKEVIMPIWAEKMATIKDIYSVQNNAQANLEERSSFVGMRRLNASKFGEALPMVTPSQARKGRCRDLTLAIQNGWRQSPDHKRGSGSENYGGKKNPRWKHHAGSSPAPGTNPKNSQILRWGGKWWIFGTC